jgi:hypothetical protein
VARRESKQQVSGLLCPAASHDDGGFGGQQKVLLDFSEGHHNRWSLMAVVANQAVAFDKSMLMACPHLGDVLRPGLILDHEQPGSYRFVLLISNEKRASVDRSDQLPGWTHTLLQSDCVRVRR